MSCIPPRFHVKLDPSRFDYKVTGDPLSERLIISPVFHWSLRVYRPHENKSYLHYFRALFLH